MSPSVLTGIFISNNMRYFLIYIGLVYFVVSGFSQETEYIEFPEKAASYPGGMDSLQVFINKNFVHPKSYESVYAKVYVRFTVGINGELSSFEILRSTHEAYSKETLRVLPLMPNWIPAEHQGKVVPSYFTLPLRFRLE